MTKIWTSLLAGTMALGLVVPATAAQLKVGTNALGGLADVYTLTQRIDQNFTELYAGSSATGLPTVPAYFGAVANGTQFPNTILTGKQNFASRSIFQMVDSAAPRFLLPGAVFAGANAVGETAIGGPTTYAAYVEYPIGSGSCIQLTQNGSTTIIGPDGGTVLLDAPAQVIPGAGFGMFHVYGINPINVVGFNGSVNADAGDVLSYGTTASPVSDPGCGTPAGALGTTGVGTLSTPNNGFSFKPIAILGQTTKPSGIVIGDSRNAGSRGAFLGNLNVGLFAEGVESYMAVINASVSGDRVSTIMGSGGAIRRGLEQYGTVLDISLGTNDLAGGAAAATIQSQLAAMAAGAPANVTTKILETVFPLITNTSVSVSALTSVGSVATAQVSSTQFNFVGQDLTFAGDTNAAPNFNGSCRVTGVDATNNKITCSLPVSPTTTTAAGTLTYTDGFSTVANQSDYNSSCTRRVALNTLARNGFVTMGFTKLIDVDRAVTSAPDSCKWSMGIMPQPAASSPSPTGDGLHMREWVYKAMKPLYAPRFLQ